MGASFVMGKFLHLFCIYRRTVIDFFSSRMIGGGLAILEVAANSYISVLGSPKYVAARLAFRLPRYCNLYWAFNCLEMVLLGG